MVIVYVLVAGENLARTRWCIGDADARIQQPVIAISWTVTVETTQQSQQSERYKNDKMDKKSKRLVAAKRTTIGHGGATCRRRFLHGWVPAHWLCISTLHVLNKIILSCCCSFLVVFCSVIYGSDVTVSICTRQRCNS